MTPVFPGSEASFFLQSKAQLEVCAARLFPQGPGRKSCHGLHSLHRHPSPAVGLQKVPGALSVPHHLSFREAPVAQESRGRGSEARPEGQLWRRTGATGHV